MRRGTALGPPHCSAAVSFPLAFLRKRVARPNQSQVTGAPCRKVAGSFLGGVKGQARTSSCRGEGVSLAREKSSKVRLRERSTSFLMDCGSMPSEEAMAHPPPSLPASRPASQSARVIPLSLSFSRTPPSALLCPPSKTSRPFLPQATDHPRKSPTSYPPLCWSTLGSAGSLRPIQRRLTPLNRRLLPGGSLRHCFGPIPATGSCQCIGRYE